MKLFTRLYGNGPSHLAAVLVASSFAVYGWTRIDQTGHVRDVVIWFIAAILAHDLVIFPLYRLLYEIATRTGRVATRPGRRVPILQHLLFPAAMSALLLLVWIPLIAHPGTSAATYQRITGVSSHPYLSRWLLITAGLFLLSGLSYAVRTVRTVSVHDRAASGQ